MALQEFYCYIRESHKPAGGESKENKSGESPCAESEQVVNSASLAGFHSEEADIRGKDAAREAGNHREENCRTLQRAVEDFT